MISINVSELRPALAGLSKVVSGRAAIESLRCIRVDAAPDRVALAVTDMEIYASVVLPGARAEKAGSFLFPLDRLQSTARRLPPRSTVHLEEGKIACDLGTGRVSENVEAPRVEEFPPEPAFETGAVPVSETFSRRFVEAMACSSTDTARYILNGVHLDVSDPASHQLVGTDGRHLFSANGFSLPLADSVTIPCHKILSWRGLADLPWALAGQKRNEGALVRVVAGDWTLTMKTIDGNYPNWRQVVPKPEQQKVVVEFPGDNQFIKLVNGLPGAGLKDKPLDLVIEGGSVCVRDIEGGSNILLAGAAARGPDTTIRLNRDYLAKALDCGFTRIGLIDPMSPLHFSREGRQMIVMPLRVSGVAPEPQAARQEPEAKPEPAPSEPQPERTTMTETNGHRATGAETPQINRSVQPATPAHPETGKTAIEAAIDKLDAIKAAFREALVGVTEITALLKQSVRDQKAGEKEIQQVRQTLRSLQGVRI